MRILNPAGEIRLILGALARGKKVLQWLGSWVVRRIEFWPATAFVFLGVIWGSNFIFMKWAADRTMSKAAFAQV